MSALTKIPPKRFSFKNHDLYGDRVEKMQECVPLRPKFCLKDSLLTIRICMEIGLKKTKNESRLDQNPAPPNVFSLNDRDLYGDGVEKKQECVPRKPKYRLKNSLLKIMICMELGFKRNHNVSSSDQNPA
jgi:hypothetical protein